VIGVPEGEGEWSGADGKSMFITFLNKIHTFAWNAQRALKRLEGRLTSV